MVPVGLLDTGPLVSFLAAGLEHHEWATEEWKRLRPPLLTCEPVLTEAAFLLKREGRDKIHCSLIGPRGDSDRPFRSTTAGGPAGAHAPLPQPADVTGRRLPGQAL